MGTTAIDQTVDSRKIAKENRVFFCTDLATRMFDEDFESHVRISLDSPSQYSFNYNLNLTGYILVDATDVTKNGLKNDFYRLIRRGMLADLSIKIKSNLHGELSDEVLICIGIYRFHFRVSKYEKFENGRHAFVDDPSSVSESVPLGRFVELKITLNKLK